MNFTFIETPIFTKRLKELMDDDCYLKFQQLLLANPTAGAIISGGGGVRKIRYALKDKGKSGGVRVIYYYQDAKGEIWLLLIYPKSEKDNISKEQLAILKRYVKKEINNE